MNYSELLQLAKGWSNLVSNRIIIWRLLSISIQVSHHGEVDADDHQIDGSIQCLEQIGTEYGEHKKQNQRLETLWRFTSFVAMHIFRHSRFGSATRSSRR